MRVTVESRRTAAPYVHISCSFTSLVSSLDDPMRKLMRSKQPAPVVAQPAVDFLPISKSCAPTSLASFSPSEGMDMKVVV